MTLLNIDDAETHLRDIIAALKPGDEIMLTENGKPLARLVRAERNSWRCKAGSARDTDHWMAPDFDAPLDEFKEYME